MVSETESRMLRILERIQADIVHLRQELGELSSKMDVGFAALTRQNDRRFLDHEGRIRSLERDGRSTRVELTALMGSIERLSERTDARFEQARERSDETNARLDTIEQLLRAKS